MITALQERYRRGELSDDDFVQAYDAYLAEIDIPTLKQHWRTGEIDDDAFVKIYDTKIASAAVEEAVPTPDIAPAPEAAPGPLPGPPAPADVEDISTWEKVKAYTGAPAKGVLASVAGEIPPMAMSVLGTIARMTGRKGVEEWLDRGEEFTEALPELMGLTMTEAQEKLPLYRSVYEGSRALVTSLAARAGGGLVGSAAGPGGTFVGAAAGPGLFFGMAQYDDIMDDLEKSGVLDPENENYDADVASIASSTAFKSAMVEGGGEFASSLLFARLAGLGRPVKGAVGNTIAKFLQVPKGRLMKDLGGSLISEISTEMGQNAAEAHFREKLGLPSMDPWEAAKYAIGPTAWMALVGGAGGAGLNVHRRNQLKKVISDPEADPQSRLEAVRTIAESAEAKVPGWGAAWALHASEAIEAGEAIDLDADLDTIFGQQAEALEPEPPV